MEHRHDNIVYIVCIFISGIFLGGSQKSMLRYRGNDNKYVSFNV
jgi:hypothetical protein